jgi:excisionase family DNA binding protein
VELLTVQETAQLLKVSTVTVRRFIADGRLPAVKVGRAVRVEKTDAERMARLVAPKARKAHRAPPVPRGRPTSADDPIWKIVGMGASKEPTDIARHEAEYLAEAYAPELK